jgi:hypothetical protein
MSWREVNQDSAGNLDIKQELPGRLVSWMGKLLLVFASAVILGSKTYQTHGHVFLSHNSE